MIAETKLSKLKELIEDSTEKELIWINGYLSGLVNSRTGVAPVQPTFTQKLTIVFGTDTGNSKKVASGFAKQLKQKGAQIKLQGIDQYRLADLQKEKYLLLVISTHGDGEPPATAKNFFDYIHNNSLALNELRYAVLALGDSAYPLFCKAGEDLDARLGELGGSRLLPLEKCDTDFEDVANTWIENVTKTIDPKSTSNQKKIVSPKVNGKKNYEAVILSNTNLNGRGSAKQTHHIELSASGVAYEPGDSLGLIPQNRLVLVNAILDETGIDPTKKIAYRKEEITVYDLLTRKVNIAYLPERLVKQYATIVGQAIPVTRMDLLNLIKIYPTKDVAQFEEVIGILEPIAPRLYSIASSLAAHEDEVHLTVVRNCFSVSDEVEYGLCSDYLLSLPVDAHLEFYIHKNSEFKLPDSEKDMIMIGPGTGVAPFRSFIEERNSTSASGRNWLFYGDQHFESDFLYQTEIQNYVQLGVLTKVNVAFSRDQEEKIYVQHKMLEEGKAVFDWLESGAHLYMCGAKSPMADDVERALVTIVEQFGKQTTEEAQAYLNQMKEDGRYQKDVY